MNEKREGEFQHNPALQAESKISCAKSGQTDEHQNPLQEGGCPHDLSDYQLELEQQNDALKENQIKLEKTLTHYVDLFDFAPVGYLYLDEKGSILEINLTAAKLLAQDRKNIINRPFIHLIPDEFKNLWDRHFLLAKQAEGKYGCELPFDFGNGATLYYHLDCVFIHEEQGVPHVRITLTDVTERKHKLKWNCALPLSLLKHKKPLSSSVQIRLFYVSIRLLASSLDMMSKKQEAWLF